MNARTLRWAASKAVVAAAPALKRVTNFYGAGVAVADAAERMIYANDRLYETPLRAEQTDFIRDYCQSNDLGFSEAYWQTPWRFSLEQFELRDATFLGHTGRLIDRDLRGVVTEWGEADSINRDKISVLRQGPALEAVALPVPRFNNNFHFLIDAATPIIDYFESGAALGGPHVILTAANQKTFATETLAALSAHYGAELRMVAPNEKVLCSQAVFYRRRRPASAWFPVTRETADKLREILLAHFGRTADPARRRLLYLRRGQEKLRNLTNTAEMDALMARHDFEAFQPAASNFADQVSLCAEAQTIVAVHGAALANILFAPPGTRVVEVFGRKGCKSGYLSICHRLGLEHVISIGGEDDGDQNFAADLDHLDASLSSPAD
ncbi:MAG: glycosyltransferase family 61 protein [Pseudomonadota bacterium]